MTRYALKHHHKGDSQSEHHCPLCARGHFPVLTMFGATVVYCDFHFTAKTKTKTWARAWTWAWTWTWATLFSSVQSSCSCRCWYRLRQQQQQQQQQRRTHARRRLYTRRWDRRGQRSSRALVPRASTGNTTSPERRTSFIVSRLLVVQLVPVLTLCRARSAW